MDGPFSSIKQDLDIIKGNEDEKKIASREEKPTILFLFYSWVVGSIIYIYIKGYNMTLGGDGNHTYIYIYNSLVTISRFASILNRL